MKKNSFSCVLVEKFWIVQNLENVNAAASDVKIVLSWLYLFLATAVKLIRPSLRLW